MSNYSAKWFALYYPLFGCILMIAGIWAMIKTDAIVKYLAAESMNDRPPVVPQTILKYFFFFTLPCLALSFFPFSWPELLFSLWSLIIVYVSGIQLVYWPHTRIMVKDNPERLRKMINIAGVMMLTVSPVIFLLGYLIIRTFYSS